MQTAEFDHNDFQNTNEADKSLLVKFLVKPKKDQQASKRAGRPIFKDTEYIDIKIPGNRTAGACRPATADDRKRFPEHYARFKQRIEEDPNEGTPLSEWPAISRSQAEELAFVHVKTVEQLANMADVQVANFMGLFELKQKAQEWLEQAKEQAKFAEVKKELEELRETNQVLRKEVLSLIESAKDDGEKTEAQKRRAKQRAAKQAEQALSGEANADHNSDDSE